MYDMAFISRVHGDFETAETVMQLCHMDYCFLQSGVFDRLSDNCKSDYYAVMGAYYDRYNTRLGVWTSCVSMSVDAFRAGVRRGTVKIA